MTENAVLVYVKRIKFSEVKPGTYFILLNEKSGCEKVKVVTDGDVGNAYLFLKLHCSKEQENNATSLGDGSVCHIDLDRKIIPTRIW